MSQLYSAASPSLHTDIKPSVVPAGGLQTRDEEEEDGRERGRTAVMKKTTKTHSTPVRGVDVAEQQRTMVRGWCEKKGLDDVTERVRVERQNGFFGVGRCSGGGGHQNNN
eukprot:GHVQ01033124.1.p3 GENE.GHVQ01033124.1~~GHVQ01033124.1.p3  ORF type:complete len:110 (+),score=30.61 GHVQ01033124.1:471-800(+)